MIKYTNNVYKGHEKETNVIEIKSDFEKVAYDMSDVVKEFIETLKPSDNDEVRYDWINAMGAGETYGSNNRGDYFPRQELIDHHHTFADNPARVYVQHVNKDPEIRLGDVLFSYFNPDTDRVELIQSIEKSRLDKYAADWVRSQLHIGEPYATSMGCKVAYDVCSKCGQKNKTVADYCDHLKYAMNQWQDGIHIHAINVDPNFFDNSIVRRGADRIARQLSKVASDIVSPADTILVDSDLVIPRKTYVFFESPKTAYINESNHDIVTTRIHEFDKPTLDLLTQYKLQDVLGTCKTASVELLPSEYQYLVLNSIGESDLADTYYYNGVRFEIPNKTDGAKIKLGFDEEILNVLGDYIPYKSLSKPLLVYNALTTEKIASIYTKDHTDLLDTIGKSYVQYLSQEKTADFNLLSMILDLFMSSPVIKDRTDRTKSNDRTIIENMSAIKQRVANVPMVPGVYNPVYKNDFLKSAGWKTRGLVNVGLPALAGAATASYLAGGDAKNELEEKERGGLSNFARRHPILTGLGAAGLTSAAIGGVKKIGFKKSAEEIDFIDEYKKHLLQQDSQNLLKMICDLPEDFASKICF